MRNIFCLLLVLFSTLCFGQKSVDVMIIKNNNDTIYSQLRIERNLFDRKLIDEASFYRRLVLLDSNGKKTAKLKASDVKKLQFIDLKGVEKTYVNGGDVLQRLVFDGKKIKWYKFLSQHMMDRSIQYFDYLVDQDNKRYNMGLFNSKRKKLLEATASKPELIDRIENSSLNDAEILGILSDFENLD